MGLTALQTGDPLRIGGFRLVGRLGSGGMGTVYLARGSGGADVAVKVMRAGLVGNPTIRARFAREAQALMRIQSPCTARVLAADLAADPPYLVTEYIQGPTLAEHVAAAGPLPPPLLHSLATGLAAALAAIHRAGVVHRDLKPSNVILAADGPKVIDFGIAVPEGATALTESGAFIGTPGFMAPEQMRGTAGAAADVFNWGLTVAYAATGRPPFGTGSLEAVAYRILHDRADLSGVPPQAAGLVAAALEKAPAARPTAERLLGLLVTPDGHAPLAAATALDAAAALLTRTWSYRSPLPPPERPRPPRRLGRALAPAAAAVGVAALTAVLLLLRDEGGGARAGAGGAASTPPRATPTPSTTVNGYAPWSDDALAAGETAVKTTPGSCFTRSIAVERADAFRCMEGNELFDPCFATDALDKVACPVLGNPYRVVVLTLAETPTRPELTTPKQLDPWLLVLPGGAHCTPNTGQAPYIGNDRANYSCDTGGTVYGFLDRTHQPWRIRYLPQGSNAITTVPVLTAWT